MKKIFDSAPQGHLDKFTPATGGSLDIAVIGMAGRIAGAGDLDSFWEGLLRAEDFITEFPDKRRKDVVNYQEHMGVKGGTADFKRAAYLHGVDHFDHHFFNLSFGEAAAMSPEQRILLETVWHTLENAGYAGDRIRSSQTGIFLGYCREQNPYLDIVRKAAPETAGMAVTGNLSSLMAGRIAHFLDLKGPSILVNTACSSSMVALHQACLAITNGDCEMALTGGINLAIIPPRQSGVAEGGLAVESADGRARSFDDSSDGTGGGEGCITLLLKSLSRALQDNDRIHAVIKGSAINQDGRSIHVAAPNSAAQDEVIVSAWKKAGVDPLTISYIEAHGTGTPLGDPIEIAGLTAAFRRYTEKRQFCAIGAVKSNIGHLDGAAGVAGVVKAILCLKHKTIVPSLHFEKPNRHIAFEDSPMYLVTRAMPWDSGCGVRRCGVSSFGISGTNAHVVLEEAPVVDGRTSPEPGEALQLFVISANKPESLQRLAAVYQEWLWTAPDDLRDICYTSCLGRGHFSCRLAIIAGSRHQLREMLGAWLQNTTESYAGYLFTGDHSGQKGNIHFEQQVRDLTRQAAEHLAGDRGKEREMDFLEGLATFYSGGADIDWDRVYRNEKRRIAGLPLYPFQPKRCWVDIPEKKQRKTAPSPSALAPGRPALHDSGSAPIDPDPVVASADDIFGQFKAYFSRNFDIPAENIRPETSVYEIGLDSITIVQVRLLIRKKYGIDIPVIDLFRKYMKIGDLSAYIGDQLKLSAGTRRPAETGVGNKRILSYRPDPRKIGKPVSTVRMADEGASQLDPAQQAWLDRFMDDYQARTAASLAYTREHMPHFANNRNVSGFRKAYRRLQYTIIADRVDGSRMWDIDGNEYIDFAMGFGVFFMGHNHPLIRAAVGQQLTRGAWLGPLSRLTGEVAGLIAELTGTQRVAFYNSGTEAVMVAIRLARAATGRKKIVTFTGAYHGMFDGLLAQRNTFSEFYEIVPLASGILQSMVDEIYILEYDDPAALRFIEEHGKEIAAVLVEPVQSRKPELQPREFLGSLRDITARDSICLIFDEIITGFRIAPGGAQQYFGVKADLVTYGKVAGGGLPIGIVAGTSEYMMGIDGGLWDPTGDTLPCFDHRRTLVAGTFCHHPLALASAQAILLYLKNEGTALYERLNRMTADFVSRINQYFEGSGIPIRVYNFGTMFNFRSEMDLRLFFYHLIQKGIYVWEGATFFVSTAHSMDDLNRMEQAIRETTRELQTVGLMNSTRQEKTLRLTSEQFKIWLRSQESPLSSALFNELIPWYFSGELNKEALDQALQVLLLRHESLRVNAITADGQHIGREGQRQIAITRADRINDDADAGHRAAMDWIKGEVLRPFQPGKGFVRAFLVQYATDQSIFGLIVNQVVADGFSLSLIKSELQVLYKSFCGDGRYELASPEPLEKYIQLTTEISDRYKKELLTFWSREWEKPSPEPFLKDPFSEPGIFSQRSAAIVMPDPLYKDIRAMASGEETTPFVILLAAHICTTATLTGRKEILTGVPSVGQLMLDNPCLVGQCMQMIPFRWEMDASDTSMIQNIRDKLDQMQQYRNFFVKDVLEYTTSHALPCHVPEIRVVLNMDPAIRNGALPVPADVPEFRISEGMMAKYDLFINVVDVNKQLHCSFQYNAAIFSDDEIRQWVIDWFNVLQHWAGGDKDKWSLPEGGIQQTTTENIVLPAPQQAVSFEIEGADGPEWITLDAGAYYRQLAHLGERLGFSAGTRIWILPERLREDELDNWKWLASQMGWHIIIGRVPPVYSGQDESWIVCGDILALAALRTSPESCHWHATRWIVIGEGPLSNLLLNELLFPGRELRIDSLTRLTGSAWYLFHHSFIYKPSRGIEIIPAGTALDNALVSLSTPEGRPVSRYGQGLLCIGDSDGKRVLTSYVCTIGEDQCFTIWSSGPKNVRYRCFDLDERLILQAVLSHPQITGARLHRDNGERVLSEMRLEVEYREDVEPLLAPPEYLKLVFPGNLWPGVIVWPGMDARGSNAMTVADAHREGLLAQCIRDALKCPQVSLEDTFLGLGGSSIRAIHLVTLIRTRMGIEVKPNKLFSLRSLKDILLPENTDTDDIPAIPVAEEQAFYPLSFDQKRFWITEQLEKGIRTSQLVEVRRVHGELEEPVFQLACLAVVARHESLRTIFDLEGIQPVQKILPAGDGAFDYRFEDWEGEPDPTGKLQDLREWEREHFFLLDKAPLFRVRLLRISPAEYATVLVTHHIIFDGWSSDVLIGDILAAYKRIAKGEEAFPRPLSIQLKDYCIWHNRLITEQSPRFQKYREKKYGTGPKPLTLLQPDKRPAFKQQQGAVVTLVMEKETTAALRRIGEVQGATLFTVVHSTLLALLYNYSGETDITIGIPIANRDHPDLQPLIGCLLNTMPVRTTFKEGDSFSELLARVRMDLAEAFEHKDYPLDLLLQDLNYIRDPSRNPLFDIGFTYHEKAYLQEKTVSGELGIRSEEIPSRSKGVMADMWFNALADRGVLKFEIVYDQAIYPESFMISMVENYRNMLHTFSARPNIRLQDWLILYNALQTGRMIDEKRLTDNRRRQMLQHIKETTNGK